MNKTLPATTETGIALRELPARVEDESTRTYAIRLMEMLPPADEDVIERIGEAILNAPTPGAENAVWETTSSRDAVGRRYIFQSCHLMDSDQPDSWSPYYLVCKVIDLDTGEATVLTTGSENIVKQLVKAQVLGNLPWEAVIAGPRKPTKLNRLPLHLVWVAKVIGPDGE